MKFCNLRAVLEIAIQRQEEAARNYGRLCRIATDQSAKKLRAGLRHRSLDHQRHLPIVVPADEAWIDLRLDGLVTRRAKRQGSEEQGVRERGCQGSRNMEFMG